MLQDELYLKPESNGANCTRRPAVSPSLAMLLPEFVFQIIRSCLQLTP